MMPSTVQCPICGIWVLEKKINAHSSFCQKHDFESIRIYLEGEAEEEVEKEDEVLDRQFVEDEDSLLKFPESDDDVEDFEGGEDLRQSNDNRSRNTTAQEESEEEELETAAQLGLDERNYDERVGEGHHMRNLARSGLSLSRARSQLVSQMRANFRATEMSPDLAQRGKSPIANAKAKASQLVMEKTKKTATVVGGNQSNTKRPNPKLRRPAEAVHVAVWENNPALVQQLVHYKKVIS